MGILDESVAIAFDLECNNILTEWEVERERQMIEAMSAGTVSRAMSGAKVTVERKEPIVLNA